MGLVIASVYSIYINSKKNANTSVEVVDLQQNIRVALEAMTADIRMAGFLIPDDDDAVISVPGALTDTDILGLNLATSTGVFARVTGGAGTFAVATDIGVSTGMAEKFRTDQGVRIITPAFPNTATDVTADDVTGVDTGTSVINLTPTAPITVDNRDVMMQINDQDDDAFPVVVRYRLINDPDGEAGMKLLQRSVNSTDDDSYETIATNINSVDLAPLPVAYSELSDITAIGVTISGTTGKTATSETKTRELQTVVKIENNFGG
jgi:hypothetical protein